MARSHRSPRSRVTIELIATCSCSHTWILDIDDHKTVNVHHPDVSDSGTYWSGDFSITCPKCGGYDDSRTM